MSWCEANGVDFLFGLAKNERNPLGKAALRGGAGQCWVEHQCKRRCLHWC